MFIIGAGRVGGALAKRSELAGVTCTLVDRKHGWEALGDRDDPIFIAVRNDDLDPVLDRIDPAMHGRLVFTQNGMLRPWLDARGLSGATRGLLFFAVPSRGASLEPGGQSPFVGPHGEALVRWLDRLDVPASTVEPDAFATTELEKLLWNCCFGLLCEHANVPVGQVVREQGETLHALVRELIDVGQGAFDLELSEDDRTAMIERLEAYSLSIPEYRGAVKEWPWRNGWFVEQASKPGVHEQLLEATGHLPRPEIE